MNFQVIVHAKGGENNSKLNLCVLEKISSTSTYAAHIAGRAGHTTISGSVF